MADTCIPGKVSLRDCEGCRWCGHCLFQQQAKFPHMNVACSIPAWFWAGYASAEEARIYGERAAVERDYQTIGEPVGKPQPIRQPPSVKPAPGPVKSRVLRGGIKLIR